VPNVPDRLREEFLLGRLQFDFRRIRSRRIVERSEPINKTCRVCEEGFRYRSTRPAIIINALRLKFPRKQKMVQGIKAAAVNKEIERCHRPHQGVFETL
jgi:hypothetical protein